MYIIKAPDAPPSKTPTATPTPAATPTQTVADEKHLTAEIQIKKTPVFNRTRSD